MPYVGIYWLTDAAERLLDELNSDRAIPVGQPEGGGGGFLGKGPDSPSSGDLSGATP